MTSPSSTVESARFLLAELGFDRPQTNERSARTLLALARLGPDDTWADATSPMLGTLAIISWIADKFGFRYAPNSRETIRRKTLHQFADALLIVVNPDDPDRPTNSDKTCYQLHPRALEVIRAYGTAQFPDMLTAYLTDVPGLKAQYDAARDLHRIPVTLPGGRELTLSPGGQNVLIRQMVDDFCGYFTPGGKVIYIGDADAKWAFFEEDAFAELGIAVDPHGKMPDLVVYQQEKNWLVLLEAAPAHGPVDAKRHGELARLFAGSTAGLVYVSCFPTRAEMRKYLPEIAWETEVWCADSPTHLVHFDGERFLGPYEDALAR